MSIKSMTMNAVKRGYWIEALSSLLVAGMFGAAAAANDPVFHLDFEKGLMPEIGPQKEGVWNAKVPPQFDENGLTGKALLITDDGPSAGNVSFTAPAGAEAHGTVLFWSRGLENWDLWGRGNNRNFWPTSTFFQTGGKGCGGWIYKWSWYDNLTYLYLPGGNKGNQAVGSWPFFDQYQWTQIGLSWQQEAGETQRLRFYLNGKVTSETSGIFPFLTFAINVNAPQKGSRRLFDNLKVFDRTLTDSEISRIYRMDAQLLNSPVVSIPKVKSAPVTDGTVAPEEWSRAAKITGLLEVQSGEMAVDQSTYYLCYDETYLYVAMIGEVTEQARTNPATVMEKFLKSERTGRDEAVAIEDTVEIALAPGYWDTDDHRQPGPGKEYRLLLNAAGGYTSCAYGAEGADAAWDIDRQSASTIGPQGWQFEARLPLATFGAAAPEPGTRWGLQLGRIWKHLKDQHDLWVWGRRSLFPPDPERMNPDLKAPPVPFQPDTLQRLHMHKAGISPLSNVGVLQFAKETTPVVRVDKIGKLSSNEIDFQATLFNPATAEQSVKIKLFTDTGTPLAEETLALPAGKETVFSKRQTITDFATSRLSFEVSDPVGAIISRTAVPFYFEQTFGVRVAQLPDYEKFKVQLDLGVLSNVPLAALRVDMRIQDAGGKSVYELVDQPVSAYLAIIEGSSAGFRSGDYTLAVVVRRGTDVLQKETSAFIKLEKAPWFDNRYGYADVDQNKVPYPWTDMKMKDDTVQVWGREYQFGKKLLPEQITTLTAPLLRAPIRLILKTADGEVLDSAALNAKAKWSRSRKTRLEGTREIKGSALALKNSFWAEYDGLVWNTLTLTPRKKVTITSLEIEIPLTKEFSDVIKAGGQHTTGKLKPEGYHGGIGYPWLGNGDGGLQIFPDRPIQVKDDRKVLHVEVKEGAATVRLALIDEPMELETARDFTLGLAATPMRPKTWRTPEYTSYRLRVGQGGGGAWYPPGYDFVPAADIGRSYRGAGEILYAWTHSLNIRADSAGPDAFTLYGAEWMTDVFQRPKENMVLPTMGSKSYRDYFVWRYQHYQDKYGYRGLYYDNPSGPLLDVRDMMKRLYNVTLGNPKYTARDTDIGLASNGAYNMAFSGFVTYQWNGENLNSVLGPNDTYRGILDPGSFRAEYMGHNYGWPARLLGQGRVRRAAVTAAGGPEAVQDIVDGLVLLHDTAIPDQMPCCIVHDGSEINPVTKRLYDAIKRHKFFHWAYQFVPYWQQQIVTLPREKMYASFYLAQPSRLIGDKPDLESYFTMYRFLPRSIQLSLQQEVAKARKELAGMKDKAILIVYNDSDWEGEMRLKPDWAKLGLGAPDSLKAENAVHSTGFRLEKKKNDKGEEVEKAAFFSRPEESARIGNNELIFPMTKFNYRMIVLEQK